MSFSLPRRFSLALLAWTLAAPLHAAAPRQKINPPPSADLSYAIKARQRGIPVEGEAVLRWQSSPKSFSVVNEVRAMLVGKILDAKSEGAIDTYGLAPSSFTEKRFRRAQTAATFDRAAKTIRFSDSGQTYPVKGGEQDRMSVIWQLISMARAAPAKFQPGTEWSFFVVGQRDADQWVFRVIDRQKISTPLGELNTLHISREPPPDSREQQVDIWLAPSLEWYPARLRFSDGDRRDYIEQTLWKLNKKAS